MNKLLNSMSLENSPKWIKLFIANILIRCLHINDKEYCLYNELRIYIDKNS